MSARKRHTAALDFMRLFMISELNLPGFGLHWGVGSPDMIDRLVKRGWLEWKRSPAHSTGNFRPIMQRKNYLYSTAKGRRAVYASDRNAEPHLRPHSWGTSGSWGRRMSGVIENHQRKLKDLAKASRSARNLHPAKRSAHT